MLVLSRHVSEKIILETRDGLVEIMLAAVTPGDKARIGIAAPTSVTIHREEVWERIRSAGERSDCQDQSQSPAA